ncbi:hypothetical protein EYF80_000850 [Liparis tanakae]|uniref:Uncharacterized protein n=1 Tax=Liparis tanakae TaxID=230148 RepID=A0A4Z2JI82_9TELE|nr:hypothetical protein EYF80_000850 [Liparis tanakae]
MERSYFPLTVFHSMWPSNKHRERVWLQLQAGEERRQPLKLSPKLPVNVCEHFVAIQGAGRQHTAGSPAHSNTNSMMTREKRKARKRRRQDPVIGLEMEILR